MNGAELIAIERQRQVAVEGWTPEHDDIHLQGELAEAARCYCSLVVTKSTRLPIFWPWSHSWWKPSDDPIRNLVKAGALIAAEIDRLQRREGRDA
jgi:hypothetical protein